MAISKHDKQALADLFVHMGVPLVVAIQTVESWSGGDAEPAEKRAEKLAKLLNISVEFSTKITKKLEIRDSYTLENVRGKIMRIVTPIIADSYVKDGNVPSEDAVAGLTDLFDVLLSFADSVSPTDDKGSKPVKIAHMIDACEPLVAAIRDHDFDMGQDRAFKESVAGLKGRSKQLGEAFKVEHPIEDGLFRSVLTIYVGCYKQAAEKNGTINDVWSECDERLAMVHGLTTFIAVKTGMDKPVLSEVKPGTPVNKAEEIKKAEDTKSDVKPTDDKPTEPTEKDKPAENGDKKNGGDDDDDGEFNPMAFFGSGGS